MAEGDTLTNALVGGLVTIVTAGFLPFAPLLGGAVSGYLQGGDGSDGARVGLYAGLIALVPLLLVLVFVASILGIVGFGLGLSGADGGGLAVGFAVVAVVGVFVVVIVLAYVVGLSTLGGWLGNYVRYETDVDV